MRILVTGACGFVGSTLIREWLEHGSHQFIGIDNFVRPGSEQNRGVLAELGVLVRHADIRLASDLESLPAVDVVVDAAANPSILAGVDGQTSSRQLVEHNLVGTINVLEYCRVHKPVLVVLSTSRVYDIATLAAVPMCVANEGFEPDARVPFPPGLTTEGVGEAFSTAPPVSLYGATKLASEQLALEYGSAFGFPVWVNRCGVLAGAGQFGRADQGIFAYWINSWLHRRPLRYIGFDGKGYQVRDCLHPADLVPLIDSQVAAGRRPVARIANVGGGVQSARSLAQLSAWCRQHLGDHRVEQSQETRTFDVPWIVLDSSFARNTWNWAPRRATEDILSEIMSHARANPRWLECSNRG